MNIIDFILKPFRKRSLRKFINAMKDDIENGFYDKFLEFLLEILRLVFLVDKQFARNIKDFDARYVFRSEDGKITSSAVFKNNKMQVSGKLISNPNVTIVFKDGEALMKFLFSSNPDIFSYMLNNELRYEGNLNYILKFGFMAKDLLIRYKINV